MESGSYDIGTFIDAKSGQQLYLTIAVNTNGSIHHVKLNI